jgi:hypothetical protein
MNIQSPRRAVHSYVQHLVAEPARVFPAAVPGARSGLESKAGIRCGSRAIRASLKIDCAFRDGRRTPRTRSGTSPATNAEAGFRRDAENHAGASPACRLSIALQATDSGCDATVTYRHTISVTPAGDAFVAAFTAEHYVAVHAGLGSAPQSLSRAQETRCRTARD